MGDSQVKEELLKLAKSGDINALFAASWELAHRLEEREKRVMELEDLVIWLRPG